jgi:peptide/nickel transport system permease protein
VTAYILRRLMGLVPTLLGISAVTFFVVHLAPGDPTSLATDLNPKVSLAARQRMRELYGLDRPVVERYAAWLGRMARLDFGNSFKDGEPVARKIARRIPVTLLVNVLSLGLILGLGIPLGIFGAVHERSPADRVLTAFLFTGFAVPTFWLALVLMSFFGVRFHVLPVSGLTSLEHEFLGPLEKAADVARHLVLPLAVTAFTSLAGIARYMRSSLLETLHQDYVRTAWSKGLAPRTVIGRHALRNALLPIITILGLSLPGLFGGSVIFETIFSIPGMGRLFYDHVLARDYPVIMGILMIGALLTPIGNFLADLVYAWADPRIRLGARRD